MRTSFAPRDAGTGRWDGGPATITNPHFEYRLVDFGGGNGEERLVCCALTYLTQDGGEFPAKFDVGNTQTANHEAILVIRESADDDADEAEIGTSFSHIDQSKQYKISPRSEFYAFTSALMAAGFPESKLASGDISVIDGLEVIVKPKARKEGDRFPLLLPFELQQKTATAAPKGARTNATAVQTSTKRPAASAPAVDDEDPADDATRSFLITLLDDSNGSVLVSKAVTKAMSNPALVTDKALKAAVIQNLQDAQWLADNAGYFTYDAKKKLIATAT